jgi:hypothetical protein
MGPTCLRPNTTRTQLSEDQVSGGERVGLWSRETDVWGKANSFGSGLRGVIWATQGKKVKWAKVRKLAQNAGKAFFSFYYLFSCFIIPFSKFPFFLNSNSNKVQNSNIMLTQKSIMMQ